MPEQIKDNNLRESKFSQIPSTACVFAVGEFEVGDNGEQSKSAPITLKARSGQPIEHWFWGRVVHDLSGMVHKAKIAIDYCHDDKEVIGYLNKFDISTGDLMTSGALVPWKDNDRATEIIHKRKEGVPYEASINFGGDGIKVEEVAEGAKVNVNGFEFDGPGVIIRQWPLRGVAICPYGADGNTEMMQFTKTNKTFSASVASVTEPEVTNTTEETQMSKPVDVVATGNDAEKATELQKPEEAVCAEVPAVDAPAVETEQKPDMAAEVETLKKEIEALKALIASMQEEKTAGEEEMKKLTEEVEDAKLKLSAATKGETVASSNPAPAKKLSTNAWADAQGRKG